MYLSVTHVLSRIRGPINTDVSILKQKTRPLLILSYKYLADPIRNIKKTPGLVILEETAVLIGLLSEYQGDSMCSRFLVTRVTNWDHLEASLTQSGTSKRPKNG